MGQCKVEGQVVAEVVGQALSSWAGIQQGGNKVAAAAFRSPLEAVQSLKEEGGENTQSGSFNNSYRHIKCI